MNKHIKKLINILGNNPDYDQEDEATKYLKQAISSGDFKPKYSTIHVEKDSFNSVAITLPTHCLDETYDENVVYGEIKQELLYTVYGKIHEDYYEWVNFFVCVSADGKNYIVGDFEDVVYFSAKKFYNDFIEEYPVEVWDYLDI